jgi:broad specificity phosphatase PhoE
LRSFLFDLDGNIVLSAAQIGFRIAPLGEHPEIIRRLIAVADEFNWLEEQDATALLLSHGSSARILAKNIMEERIGKGKRPDWQMTSWRILQHLAEEGIRP